MRAVRFDARWGFWLATAAALTASVLGWPPGLRAAIVLTALQVVHFARRRSGRDTLPLQVRLLFLAVLLLCLWPPLAFLQVAPLVGAWANILFGYCLAARLLSLLPWNRRAPLSVSLVAWTFLSPPAPGSIVARVPASLRPVTGGVAVRRASAGEPEATPSSPQH
jgi:hypothetical protein